MNFSTMSFLALSALAAVQQPQDSPAATARRTVAILVHEGIELLDFAGPGEVFSAARSPGGERAFDVYLVAASREPIRSQGFVEITPRYTFADCPPPDVVVLPGGATGRAMRDSATMRWVDAQGARAEVILSVCTGALLLAKAGLLDGLDATTHHGSLALLRKQAAGATVHEDKRFVDNGQIVTAAGVSAGIDGALHIVERLLGRASAVRAARYMEYDYDPDAAASRGLVARAATAEVGQPAPYFCLEDTHGKRHRLGDYAGKIVVLQWTSHVCPTVNGLHDDGTIAAARAEVDAIAGERAVWLCIDSSRFCREEVGKIRSWRERQNSAAPYLLDAKGHVGRAYQATNTPHAFVIAADGKLAYAGAVAGRKDEAGKRAPFVADAVRALVRGEELVTPKTAPFGCTIKYRERAKLDAPRKPDGRTYVCPPCPVDCHDRTYDRPGRCAVCSMELVPKR